MISTATTVTWIMLFIGCLSTQPVKAAWSSGGGGEIIKDARNPWFVQNTNSINICAIHDAEHFNLGSLAQADIERIVQDATRYWRAEFAGGYTPWPAVQIATQSINIVEFVTIDKNHPPKPCNLPTDITIQLGYLDVKQKNYLAQNGQSPKDFISLAIRTEYDPKSLRGKGFIYIAADSGDLKFEGPDLVSKPWSMGNGGLLHAALKHEFGHVFGLPHMGSSLMNANYLEYILKAGVAESASNETHEKDFFAVSRNGTLRSFCPQTFSKIWARFLGISSEDRCYEYKLNGNQIDLFFGKTQDDLRNVGTITMEPVGSLTWSEAIKIYLTKQEDVYHNYPPYASEGPWLFGPMIKTSERSGLYTNKAGTIQKPVIATFSPLSVGDTYVKFAGEMDGKLLPNLEWGIR